jgi:hypothetical protein
MKIAALLLALVSVNVVAAPIATCGDAAQMVSMIQEGRINGQPEEDVIAHIRDSDDISIREEDAAVKLVAFVYHNDVAALKAGQKLLGTCVVASK